MTTEGVDVVFKTRPSFSDDQWHRRDVITFLKVSRINLVTHTKDDFFFNKKQTMDFVLLRSLCFRACALVLCAWRGLPSCHRYPFQSFVNLARRLVTLEGLLVWKRRAWLLFSSLFLSSSSFLFLLLVLLTSSVGISGLLVWLIRARDAHLACSCTWCSWDITLYVVH